MPVPSMDTQHKKTGYQSVPRTEEEEASALHDVDDNSPLLAHKRDSSLHRDTDDAEEGQASVFSSIANLSNTICTSD